MKKNWVGPLWLVSASMAVLTYAAIGMHLYLSGILFGVLGTVFGLSGFAVRFLLQAREQWANRDS